MLETESIVGLELHFHYAACRYYRSVSLANHTGDLLPLGIRNDVLIDIFLN